MSKFVVLKSAGLGNRIKLYVSYLQRYDEVLIEKEPDLHLFENFKLCDKDEDIKIHPWTHSGWRLLVNEDEEDYDEDEEKDEENNEEDEEEEKEITDENKKEEKGLEVSFLE